MENNSRVIFVVVKDPIVDIGFRMAFHHEIESWDRNTGQLVLRNCNNCVANGRQFRYVVQFGTLRLLHQQEVGLGRVPRRHQESLEMWLSMLRFLLPNTHTHLIAQLHGSMEEDDTPQIRYTNETEGLEAVTPANAVFQPEG